jgi:AcrR family transcriptional regulator
MTMLKHPPADTLPVQARARERLAEVLAEAERMLTDEGYAVFTMRKLAERCGMALGNLQYYFPSKSDLVAALVENIYERHQHRLANRADMTAAPREAMEALLRYILDDICKPEGSALFWELWVLAARDGVANAAMTKFYRTEQAVIEEAITRLNPELPHRLTRLRAKTIMGMMEGSTLLVGMGRPDARAPKPLINEIIASMLAIAARPAEE